MFLTGSVVAAVATAIRNGRPLEASSVRSRLVLGGFAAAGTVALAAGLVMCVMPGLVGFVVALLIGLATGIAIWQRGAGERAALNEAIALAVSRGIPLDRLGVAFAGGRRDTLGGRAYRFAQGVHAGAAPERAAAMAGLRLAPEVRSSFLRPAPQGTAAAEPVLAETAPSADDTSGPGTLIAACYLTVLLLFGSFAVAFLIAPQLRELFEYFDIEQPPWLAAVDLGLALSPAVSSALVLAFGVVLGLWWMMHRGWLGGGRWLPVIGPYYRDHHDAQALHWLAGGIAEGQSLDRIEEELPRAHVGPAEARLRRAVAAVREGADWPAALGRAGLVSRRALPWLAVAHGGDHLARALREVADARRSRATESLKVRLRILGPIGVVIAALPVLLFGLLLFGMFTYLLQGLA